MERPIERPEAADIQLRRPNDAECNRVLEVGRKYARLKGVHRQDLDDTAMGFVVRILAYMKIHPEIDPSVILSPQWLASAAANWVNNCLRDQWLRQRQEVPLPADSPEEGAHVARYSSELIFSNDPSPEAQAFQTEFHGRMYDAVRVSRLTEDQRELLQLYMDGESVPEIAQRLNVKEDTVRYRLRRIRDLLRSSFRAHGIGEADIAAFRATC